MIIKALSYLFLGSALFSQVDFSSQIQPIFDSKCIGCHGSSGGLNLNSFSNLMAGTSNHGPVITPGNADNSILVQKLSTDPPFGSRMPMNDQGYFDSHEEELQLIVDWIDEGANETPLSNTSQNFFAPTKIEFLNNYPNPFNPSTTLTWIQDKPEFLELYIYTLPGQLVEHITLGEYSGGYHQFIWQPEKLSSGMYILNLQGDNFSAQHKIIYSK